MRVLIAEDSAPERFLLKRAVEALRHEALEADNGSLAWEIIGAKDPDVIISDWLMPGVDGAELCRRVRARGDAAPYAYFIFLTLLDDEQHLLEAMRSGGDDYLNKPFNAVQLEARLIAAERVVTLHRAVRERSRLDGVLLAARTMSHEVNNRLSLTAGYAELLANDALLPEHLRETALQAARGTHEAADIINQLHNVTRLEELRWGSLDDTTLDLTASSK